MRKDGKKRREGKEKERRKKRKRMKRAAHVEVENMTQRVPVKKVAKEEVKKDNETVYTLTKTRTKEQNNKYGKEETKPKRNKCRHTSKKKKKLHPEKGE